MRPPDLRTRAGRIQHVRLSLAVRFGNVSLERFGQLVAAEEAKLTGTQLAPYKASTVKRWEAGAEPSWDAGRAIASLAGRSLEWLISGDQRESGADADATQPESFRRLETGDDLRNALGEPPANGQRRGNDKDAG